MLAMHHTAVILQMVNTAVTMTINILLVLGKLIIKIIVLLYLQRVGKV